MKNKLTKIVATISDLNCSVEFLTQLYENGMNVVRLNTAHQGFEETLKVIKNVKKVSDRIALLLDTKGPEIRTSKTDGEILLKTGDVVKIKCDDYSQISTKEIIYVSYSGFVDDVKIDQSILIDDGDLELKVTKKGKDYLLCEVKNNGAFKSNKSVNVPGVHLNLPSLSKKDNDYIKFAIENDIDFIAHSFVRNKEDVIAIQRILDKNKSKIKIIAKIENREGVDNLDEILDFTYGVMVARGDLGIEIPAEEVPLIQKKIIKKCVERQRPVITATQMLHTMIKNPRPTRAEVSDIANAIYDGTDAIMLSGETAYGSYPVEAVRVMSKIAKQVELEKPNLYDLPVFKTRNRIRSVLAKSAIFVSQELSARAIVAHTISGHSARVISSYRAKIPVYAKCFDKRVVRELALSYGIYSYIMKPVNTTDKLVANALKELVKDEKLEKEDLIILLGATPPKEDASANFMEICKVSDYI